MRILVLITSWLTGILAFIAYNQLPGTWDNRHLACFVILLGSFIVGTTILVDAAHTEASENDTHD